ncbi:DUF362 domain-containing protein [Prolixibacteraceae bacterium JC049]|nr:DUF362 domain-containing protein [Prolixibacteraceae bacterium JC049]
MSENKQQGRRNFFKILSSAGIATAMTPILAPAPAFASEAPKVKPKTNIDDALKHPRTKDSMPGKYPAQVIKVTNTESVKDGIPNEEAAYEMLKTAMLSLTEKRKLKKAWRQFVSPKDKIGLKVNPVAGKQLTTSHAVVKAVIRQLEEAGVPRKNIVIWDRREMQLHETGFTTENYPEITISGTEQKDKDGGFRAEDGQLYGEKMIDKGWFYWADIEGEYDEYTLPYMVNGGKHSYFSKIVTQQVDKIINIPILKNAGGSSTLCLKNLAYGSVTNTGRLHKQLWAETTAQVCAFPPLRDKVVLNIVDGLKGCYNGGPSANPQFICNYNTLLVGSDAVAVDRIGHDIVMKKRMKEGLQKEEKAYYRKFMDLANEYQLGESDINKIKLTSI